MKKLKFNINDLKVDNFKSKDVDESKLNAISFRDPCEFTFDIDRCDTFRFCITENSHPACNPNTTTHPSCGPNTTTDPSCQPNTTTDPSCQPNTTTHPTCTNTRRYPCDTFPIRLCFESFDQICP